LPIASLLVALSSSVVLSLGTAHLVFTFRGPKFDPRDAALRQRMHEVSPVISRETTMWRAWVGFNASHSFGAMLFGSMYGYLALAHPAVLFGSPFLLGLGLVTLSGYLALARAYWFRVPFNGILLALISFAGGVIASVAQS
jgi:hypothetical protein